MMEAFFKVSNLLRFDQKKIFKINLIIVNFNNVLNIVSLILIFNFFK